MLSNSMSMDERDLFDKMIAGEVLRSHDPQFSKVIEVVTRTHELSVRLNASTHIDLVRERLSQLIGNPSN